MITRFEFFVMYPIFDLSPHYKCGIEEVIHNSKTSLFSSPDEKNESLFALTFFLILLDDLYLHILFFYLHFHHLYFIILVLYFFMYLFSLDILCWYLYIRCFFLHFHCLYFIFTILDILSFLHILFLFLFYICICISLCLYFLEG